MFLFFDALFEFLVFVIYLYQMANYGLGMAPNIIFDIFGNFQMSSEFANLDSRLLQDYLEDTREYKLSLNA